MFFRHRAMFSGTLAIVIFTMLGGCDSDESDTGLNCGEGSLFNYGISSITYFNKDENGEWRRYEGYSYEYNHLGQRTTGKNMYWWYYNPVGDYELDGYSYDEQYYYDDQGRPYLETWVNGTMTSSREWSYDDQGRLVSDEITTELADGTLDRNVNTYEYDSSGRLSRHWAGWRDDDSELHISQGDAFEYDSEGKMIKKTILSPDNDWAPTDQRYEYEYDDLGRVSKENSFIISEFSGEPVEIITEFGYAGGTGWLVSLVRGYVGQDESRYEEEYQHDDNTLTIIGTSFYNGEGDPYYKVIVEYTDEGDSAFYELVKPNYVYNWIMDDYGNGYFNGCAGLE